MKPQELIDGLRYLADQCPLDAVVFRVPSAPACTDHNMRLDVSPADIRDLIDHIETLDQIVNSQLTKETAQDLGWKR